MTKQGGKELDLTHSSFSLVKCTDLFTFLNTLFCKHLNLHKYAKISFHSCVYGVAYICLRIFFFQLGNFYFNGFHAHYYVCKFVFLSFKFITQFYTIAFFLPRSTLYLFRCMSFHCFINGCDCYIMSDRNRRKHQDETLPRHFCRMRRSCSCSSSRKENRSG